MYGRTGGRSSEDSLIYADGNRPRRHSPWATTRKTKESRRLRVIRRCDSHVMPDAGQVGEKVAVVPGGNFPENRRRHETPHSLVAFPFLAIALPCDLAFSAVRRD
jgi:hypothetical protein